MKIFIQGEQKARRRVLKELNEAVMKRRKAAGC
jgi:hypothetical protein